MHRSESSRSFGCKIALASALALFTTQDSRAGLVGSYTIGTGSQTSFVQFEFANQNTYLYSVRHDGNLRGSDLLAIMASGQPGFFSYQVVSFGFGDALFGVTVGADSNGGFGTPPDYLDYWHYWTRNGEAQAWATSMIGFGDRGFQRLVGRMGLQLRCAPKCDSHASDLHGALPRRDQCGPARRTTSVTPAVRRRTSSLIEAISGRRQRRESQTR